MKMNITVSITWNMYMYDVRRNVRAQEKCLCLIKLGIARMHTLRFVHFVSILFCFRKFSTRKCMVTSICTCAPTHVWKNLIITHRSRSTIKGYKRCRFYCTSSFNIYQRCYLCTIGAEASHYGQLSYIGVATRTRKNMPHYLTVKIT